jgi:hypothetical protein
MELKGTLQSIESILDLQALVVALGHQPVCEAVPPEAWNNRGSRAFTITVVGQSGKVPWLAIESRSPQADALLLARRISRRGKTALVLALDGPARQLGIAVAFDRSPGILIQLTRPDPEALASLSRLAGSAEPTALAFGARVAEALSTEPVGRRFFREFKATLDRMAAALPGPMPSADRYGVVLLQLTRVLFLYFIQSKGWLDGREQFLAEQVDRCLSGGRQIDRHFLRPLFFGTLNQPPADRSGAARRFGAVPFLNGGLFEPHPLERRHYSAIPNPLWRDAFGNLFERFHFTVVEGGGGRTVAPDMLGRVFEGVMDPDARRASGTFYTPARLVERLFEAALVLAVSTRMKCSETEAARRLEDRDGSTARVLRGITVLDPAVGSGAFLLGALERLSAAAAPCGAAAHNRQVLQHSLFGVDRNAAAVRLTELRLWLSVIADDPSDRAECVHPLPNLDCLIRQGDSLFEPSGLETVARAECADPSLARELSSLRRQLIAATGQEKQMLVRRLRQLEARAMDQSFLTAERRQATTITECLQQARTPDLFGQRRGLDPELRGRLTHARFSLRDIRRARRRLSTEGEFPWFHYQSAFADVFARGGFDLVVGNPPWLRCEAIPAVIRKQLRARYRWWRGGGPGYGKSPDLAVAFLERAFDLAAPSGIVAMLVPAKVATAGYGSAARHALASTTTIHALADLTGTEEASFDATVYPLAVVAQNSTAPSTHRVRTQLAPTSRRRLPQSLLRGGGPWVLTYSGVRGIVAELERRHPILSQSLTCHLGVKTGLNRFFLNPPSNVESQVLRWAIRGRDVRPFRCLSRRKMLWTHDERGNPVSRLPPNAQAYVNDHEPALRARRDYQSGPPWAVFRARPAVARYRVVWSDMARRLTATALSSRDPSTHIPLNTCYLASVRNATQAHALAGWLNSTWIRAIAVLGAVPASGGFSRFNARVVNQLPLPPVALLDPALAQLARRGRAGLPVQPELDTLVARHLGLSTTAQRALHAVDSRRNHHR